MLIQDDIFLTVLNGKRTAACWSTQLLNKEEYGDKIDCCMLKLMLLVTWIENLESYYCTHYNGDAGTITPDYECLTLAEAQDLLSKLKAFIGA